MANIYLKIWNADTNEDEEREFFTSEIDELMDAEIIDTDALGYAMKDTAAFAEVMDELDGKAYTYGEIVERYIERTGERIVIEA